MRKHWLIPAVAVALAAAAILVLAGRAGHSSGAARANDVATMDAVSIDMDPAAAPANTATSIGSREFCARVNENDTLDADEDAVDTLEIDVTTGPVGVPAEHPTNGYQFSLLYPAGQFAVIGEDQGLLLTAHPGSELFSASEPFPDSDGEFASAAIDVALSPESGPGVLSRLLISLTGTETGVHHLIVANAAAVSPDMIVLLPDDTGDGVIAVGADCPAVQPPHPVPANDAFADAQVIADIPFRTIFHNTDSATSEPGEPSPCGGIANTVWYEFTPQVDGEYGALVGGDYHDPAIAVYSGSSLSDLVTVACHAGWDLQASVGLSAKAGVKYYIQVGGTNGMTGNISFGLYLAPTPAPSTPTPPVTPPPWWTPTPPPFGTPPPPGVPGLLRIDSAEVAPGGSVTVALRTYVDPPGVAAFTIDVQYDRSIVTATGCESAIGLCNPAFEDDQVRFVGAHPTGFAGVVEFGTITFQAGPQEGESGVDISVDQITDFEGIDISPWFTVHDGAIRVTSNPATPTPAPIPVPVTTPEPSPAPIPSLAVLPGAFPPTGGPPGAASGWRTSAALAAAGALAAAAATILIRRRTR